MRQVYLTEVDLPEFGLPTVEPKIPAETYEQRLRAARHRFHFLPPVTSPVQTGAMVVYGDREHFANLAYLTGYDPRFEEALLIIPVTFGEGARPTLVVGNEGWGYVPISPIELNRVLYQDFSLLGQPRGKSQSLEDIFRQAGITEGSAVGVVGWKYFDNERSRLEIPSYIADTLRTITGDTALVQNLTHEFMDPLDGLRAINDVDQLAVLEFAATHSSQAIRNVLFGLKPGMTEYDAVRLMQYNGIPLSAHLMLSSGKRAWMGLPSPSMRVIEQGDPLTTALGLWGALNARAGFVVKDAHELPENIRDYVDKLVAPYFRAVVSWYEHIGIGVAGGELYRLIHEQIGDPFFGVSLNPGHLIHLDEWVHSPIYQDSNIRLKSGMALQVDVIPGTGSPYFTTNIEDGIALADEELRAAFAAKYPEAWGRIQARRAFMQDTIGIRLKPEVLPFSNIPACLPPFLLNPRRVMSVKN
jgi:hypothetical protein